MTVTQKLKETIDYIKEHSSKKNFPKTGVVLGSGLGSFVQSMDIDFTLPFQDIPHFVPPTIEGHGGNFVFGSIKNTPVIVLQGRIHYYEGHSMSTVTYPVFTLAMLGVKELILTNSSGGLLDKMQPGHFMAIEDHINLTGTNPLIGPHLKDLGPRFFDMTEAYDKKLTSLLIKTMEENQIPCHKGIYCGVSGPSYETPAEINFFRLIGAGAVGMSTVPETIAANFLGLRVCGISCITNMAAGISKEKLNHEDVTDTAKQVENHFATVLAQFIAKI